MTEIKPCPFCDYAEIKIKNKSGYYEIQGPYIQKFQASCDSCCTDMNAPTDNEVVQRWNTRAPSKDRELLIELSMPNMDIKYTESESKWASTLGIILKIRKHLEENP